MEESQPSGASGPYTHATCSLKISFSLEPRFVPRSRLRLFFSAKNGQGQNVESSQNQLAYICLQWKILVDFAKVCLANLEAPCTILVNNHKNVRILLNSPIFRVSPVSPRGSAALAQPFYNVFPCDFYRCRPISINLSTTCFYWKCAVHFQVAP